jgi:hypothetical protein
MARSRSTHRGTLGWSCIVIITLLLMPTFVRAMRSFEAASSTAPSIRLNRGFDAPESKCEAPAPETARIVAAVAEVETPRLHDHPAPVVDLKPVSQHDAPPDAFRGPPSFQAIA